VKASYPRAVTELEHPSVDDLDLPAVLFALSDPARLAIVRQVADCGVESTCQSVALDMPKSTRSHHLKVLREAGVLRMTVRGRERVLSLRRDDVESRWPGLLTAVLVDEPLSI
jgi:DNA-binding transcriptional ArsR family regulator